MRLKIFLITFLLGVSLLLNIWLRLVTLPVLNGNLLLGTDPARYTRLAEHIVENGGLPEKDMMRWVPLGKETKKQLTLFPYLIAYLYRSIKIFLPNATVQQVAIIVPVVLSTIALMVLFFLVRKLFDVYTALLSVNIAAISPPLAGRTLAGFADKDGLALLLGLIAFYFYIQSLHDAHPFKRFTFAIAFGISMTLLGLTWEGVGVFVSVTVITEFIMLLFDGYNLQNFTSAVCRYVPILVGLPLLKTIYRELHDPFVLLVIGPPLFLLLLSLLCSIASRSQFVQKVLSLGNRVPVVLSVSAAIAIVILVFSLDRVLIFGHYLFSPFGSSRLAQSIEELEKQGVWAWAFWPGAFFLVSCAGAIITYREVLRRLKINILTGLILFEIFLMGVPFSRIFLFNLHPGRETKLTVLIYLGTLILFTVGTFLLYMLAIRRGEYKTDVTTYERLFLIVWFGLMLMLLRSAVRFEFLFAIPVAILGAHIVVKLLRFLTDKFKVMVLILLSVELWQLYAIYSASTQSVNFSRFNSVLLLSLVAGTMVILFMILKDMSALSSSRRLLRFCGITCIMVYVVFTTSSAPAAWIGSYAEKSYKSNIEQRPFVTPELEKALRWMDANLPPDTTVAAWWEYGSWINLIGKKRTIIDEEQIQHWLYLMARHVFLETGEREALDFLYTHQAKYLMITQRDIGALSTISVLGSDEAFDKYAKVLSFGAINETIRTDSGKIIYRYLRSHAAKEPLRESFSVAGKHYQPEGWQISSIYLQIPERSENSLEIAVLVEVNNGKQVFRLRPEEVYFKDSYVRQKDAFLPSTLLIDAPSEDPTDWTIVYLSPKVRQTLIAKLFLLNMQSAFFISVYPDSVGSQSSARIWKIRYPEGIALNKEYLKTQ